MGRRGDKGEGSGVDEGERIGRKEWVRMGEGEPIGRKEWVRMGEGEPMGRKELGRMRIQEWVKLTSSTLNATPEERLSLVLFWHSGFVSDSLCPSPFIRRFYAVFALILNDY